MKVAGDKERSKVLEQFLHKSQDSATPVSPLFKDDGGNCRHIVNSRQSTMVDEADETASVGDIEEAGEESGINFLSAWSLPNIADQRSAVFSIHFLVV